MDGWMLAFFYDFWFFVVDLRVQTILFQQPVRSAQFATTYRKKLSIRKGMKTE